MRAYLMGNDVKLLELLEKRAEFSIVVPILAEFAMDREDEVAAELVLLVSDTLANIAQLVLIRESYPQAIMIYLLSNQADSANLKRTQSLCAAHRIDYISPYHTVEQVVQEIVRICFAVEESQGKVIAGMSVMPQSGLTSSLLLLGARLAEVCDIKVGILGMNGWNPGDAFIPYHGKYLDEIWGSLNGKQMQADDLIHKMDQIQPNVYYLAGNRDLKKLYYYQIEGVAWLIKEARKHFDVILLDVGSYLDHALAAQSIYSSDLLLVQMNQSQQAREQWQRTLQQIVQPVLNMNPAKMMLFYNKMYRGQDIETEKQISSQMDLPYIASLPYAAKFYQHEIGKNLFAFDHEDYRNELNKAVRGISQWVDLPLKEAGPEKLSTKPIKGLWLAKMFG